MLNKSFIRFALFALCALAAVSCASKKGPLEDPAVTAVIITRSDDLRGVIQVYINGEPAGKIKPGGKWGKKLGNGRHSISVVYQKKRSEVYDFQIYKNQQHFRTTAFENDRPSLTLN
ncbi:MAG: hypothetical protein LBC77_08255 [Spirochaetaceae bacterium]|jgi:hypothetical protein|nr:hypothetical protein [Spirochaetaceae bacterium]